MFRKIFFSLSALFLIASLCSCSKPGDATVTDGMHAFREGKYEDALSYLNQALDENTNYSKEMIYTLLANTYAQMQDWDNAIKYHKLALERREEYSSWILLGALSHQAGYDDQAEDAYKKAIDNAPKRPEAYGSLGALYLMQDKIDDALQMLEKSVSLNSRLGVVQGDLAIAYAMKGRESEALAALELAQKYKAENIESFKAKVASALGKGPALTSSPVAK